MADTSQARALKRFRQRLAERGLARFEVLGLKSDRELIRSVARRLANEGSEAVRMRTTLRRAMSPAQQKTGGVLQALRRSPLVGADLTVTRSIADDRKVHL